VLYALLLPVFAVTFLATPEGKLNWLLEVGPGLIGVAVLAGFFKRFEMSRFVYLGVFVHVLVLVYGGYYTYAKAPLGEWMREAFHFHRNHYDRIGHFFFGFVPVFVIREVLMRNKSLQLKQSGWLNFILVAVVLGLAASYEFIEWWAALLMDPEGGDKFLGTQGDIWDAQWDMLFAGIGATVGLLTLRRLHDRSMAMLTSSPAPPPR
jgi:putative membrane protein